MSVPYNHRRSTSKLLDVLIQSCSLYCDVPHTFHASWGTLLVSARETIWSAIGFPFQMDSVSFY